MCLHLVAAERVAPRSPPSHALLRRAAERRGAASIFSRRGLADLTNVAITPPVSATRKSLRQDTPDSTQRWMQETFSNTQRVDSPACGATPVMPRRNNSDALRRSILAPRSATTSAAPHTRHLSSADVDDHRLPLALPSTADPLQRARKRQDAATRDFDSWYGEQFKTEIEEIVVAVKEEEVKLAVVPEPAQALRISNWFGGSTAVPEETELGNVADISGVSSAGPPSPILRAADRSAALHSMPGGSSFADLSSVMLDRSVDEDGDFLDASCESLHRLYQNSAPTNAALAAVKPHRVRLSSLRLKVDARVSTQGRYSELAAVFGGKASSSALAVDAQGAPLRCIVSLDELFGATCSSSPSLAPAGQSLCQCTVTVPSFIPAHTRTHSPSGRVVVLPFTIYELAITAVPLEVSEEAPELRRTAGAGRTPAKKSRSGGSPASRNGQLRWSVFRRYSDFERLAKRLGQGRAARTIGQWQPRVPPKTWWSHCPTGDAFLAQRQHALQKWLQLVLGLPALLHPSEASAALPRELLDFVRAPIEVSFFYLPLHRTRILLTV